MNKKDFVVVIPARLNSTRIKKKPLVNINGLPLVIKVCQRVAKFVDKDKVFVATEDLEVLDVCERFGFTAVITKDTHEHPLERVYEVASDIMPSKAYLVVNGDEPFFSDDTIPKLIQDYKLDPDFYVSNAASQINNVADALDPANIKIVVNSDNYAIYCSRAAIPQPFGDLSIKYRKFVGLGLFSYEALEFFNGTKESAVEKAERISLLRFLAEFKKVKIIDVEHESSSIDTHADLVVAKRVKM
jgi:3-deoxy-manno-octulosonate cytidylyltransferase (CMP-KDO synthetase)